MAQMTDSQKQVQEVGTWLQIAKTRGLRFSGDSNEWLRFSMDFKNLMHSLNKVSAIILHSVEDVLPDDIQPIHYPKWDDQGQVVKGQDGRPVLPK